MHTIAIDALGISQPGGGRSATLNVLKTLLRQGDSYRYLLLLDRPEPELAVGEHVHQAIVPLRQRILARSWAQLAWPFLFRRWRVDLVHYMRGVKGIALPGRSIVTVYDLTVLLYPEIYPLVDVLYWRFLQPRMLRKADRLVAISQETAKDLVRFYQLPRERIRVIYPAYDPRFRPLPRDEVAKVCLRYGLGQRFLLHVGSLSRKKNLLTLLRAYEHLVHRGYKGQLALVGRLYGKGYDAAFFDSLAQSPVRERVLLLGAVSDRDLVALYNGADAFVFPSLHEGFGIVALEAMACGTPVIASRVGALPEVVGDAGVLLPDPRDAEALAEAVERVLYDREVRQSLVSRGLERVKRFSTVKAAEETLALYSELLA